MKTHTIALALTLGLGSWLVACSNAENDVEAAEALSPTGDVVEGASEPSPTVEREFWLALAEEPAWHMDHARDDFLKGQNRLAARELEKVAAIMNFEVRHAHSQREEGLLMGSIQELREVARQLRYEENPLGGAPSLAELDHVFALAFRTMATHQVVLGREALEAGDHRMAGLYVQETAKAIQSGFERSGVDEGNAMKGLLRGAIATGQELVVEGEGSLEDGLAIMDDLDGAVEALSNVLTSRRS